MNSCLKVMSVVLLAAFFCWPGAASAQPPPGIRLSFDKHFYDRNQNFSAKTTITNETSETMRNTKLTLSVFPKIEETGVVSSFDRRLGPLLIQNWYQNLPVGTTEVTLGRSINTLGLDEGVYPAEIGLTLANRQIFIDRSFLVILEPRDPVEVAIVWNLHQPEHRLPGGTFVNNNLAALVQKKDGGLLEQQLAIVKEHPDIKANLAISPTLLSQLSDIADGYTWREERSETTELGDGEHALAAADWIKELKNLWSSGQIQILTSPYGQIPPPVFSSPDWKHINSRQLTLAKESSKKVLGRSPRGIYLPGLMIDDHTAAQLGEKGFRWVVAETESSETPSRPQPPLHLKGKSRRLILLDADREFTGWLSTAYHEKVAQEMAALLAVRLLNKTEDGIITIAPDTAHWLPSPQLLQAVYSALDGLDWVKTIKIDSVPKRGARRAELSAQAPAPDRTYKVKLEKGLRDWQDFEQATLPTNSLRQELERQFFTAQSIDYIFGLAEEVPDTGRVYLSNISKTVDAEFSKLDVSAPTNITFSSRVGKIPIVIVNRTGYPVKARLQLTGKDFLFLDDTKNVTLTPKDNLISTNITAGFTGLSRMKATVFVGNREVASRYVQVSVSSYLRYLVVTATILIVLGGAAIFFFRGRLR